MRKYLSALAALSLLFACTGKEEEAPVVKTQSIVIEQGDMTLREGESVNLSAKVLPDNASDNTISWSSSNESIVMVSSNGKVMALSLGKAIITAKSGDKSDFITITVEAKVIPVSGVSLDKTQLTIKVGESETLTPTITPEDATNKKASWTSSNDRVATVEDGKVVGVEPGSVTITVTTEDGAKTAECPVTVKSNLAPSVTVGAEHISAVSAVLSGKANLESTTSSDLKVGFQYSKSAGILPSNSITIEATDADADYNYTASITGLEPDTKYYFRSFIRQNGQDTYGETKEFTTKALSSMLHTNEATSVSAVSACLNATLDLTDVRYESKSLGFYWGSSAESVNSKLTAYDESDFISLDLLKLTPSKEYYFRAYIVLDGKEYKEEVVSFTTKDIESILGTLDATGIEATKASLNAKLDLTDVKYSSISYGFYWGNSENYQNNRLSGGEIKDNAYSSSLTNLSHKAQYWYKAYVTLDSQTFYGEVKTFTTDVVHVESVSLNKTEYIFNTIGNTLTLTATIAPGDATDKSVTWTSDKEDVATVTTSGVVTAKGNGTATITVKTKDQEKTATCEITVAQWVTSITLNSPSLTLNEGLEQTLTATVNPTNANDPSLTWTSSDEDIAKVDQTGKVTAISKGTATIKAAANDGSGKYASCSVTVKRLVSSIVLDKPSLVVYNGKTETITATVSPSTANNTGVTWSSSNTTVATVSSSGVVTGKSRGTATITVTANDGSGVSAACAVEVKQYVTSISLDKTSLSLVIGAEATLSVASVLPDNANDNTYTWSSSDSAIASVDNSGKVTAKIEGKATIKATANDGSGVFASCSVEVYRIDVPQAVDMGTVVNGKNIKWASFNVGASSPEEYGFYYAWGETEPKDNYSWSTYKFRTSGDSYSNVKFSKYNTSSSYGPVDNKTVLESSDDVASVKLGGKWRMPTDAEWTELRTKCTWTWTTNYNGTGVKGQIVTATNGNSIFLPAAGDRRGTTLYGAGSGGYYWSSSLSTDDPNFAWGVYFDSDYVTRHYYSRYFGRSVRPVSE